MYTKIPVQDESFTTDEFQHLFQKGNAGDAVSESSSSFASTLVGIIVVMIMVIGFAVGGYFLYKKMMRATITVSVEDQEAAVQHKEELLPRLDEEETKELPRTPPPEEEKEEEEPELPAQTIHVRNAKSQREVISIHVGGAGCNLGGALWELFCVEHGLEADGRSKKQSAANQDLISKNFFFSDKATGKMVPRSIFIDLEPSSGLNLNLKPEHRSPLDRIRTGPYRDLFEPDQLLSHKEEALTYGSGYYSDFIETSLDGIRKVTERCDSMQGFLLFNAISGGTGSGFSSILLERLADEYDRKSKLAFSIYPNDYSHPLSCNQILEPYNAVMHLSKLIDHVDVSFTLENQAVYRMCQQKLNIQRPTYGCLNRMIAQVISSLTVSLRRTSDFNIDINEYQTNLVPFQRRHFMLTSFSPIDSINQENSPTFVDRMTAEAFDPSTLLADCQQTRGDKYMACCLIYRGDVSTLQANSAVDAIKHKKTVNFVDWCPTGFKVGINSNTPGYVEGGQLAEQSRQVTMISNNTSVQQVFGRICQRFDKLFDKRAFMKHCILSRMDEMDLQLAREDLNTLNDFYDEIKAEPERRRANRVSYLPTATATQKVQSEAEITQVFENRRSMIRKSVLLPQTSPTTHLQPEIANFGQSRVSVRQSQSLAMLKNRVSRMVDSQVEEKAPSKMVGFADRVKAIQEESEEP